VLLLVVVAEVKEGTREEKVRKQGCEKGKLKEDCKREGIDEGRWGERMNGRKGGTKVRRGE
jgi:hypothetical protein